MAKDQHGYGRDRLNPDERCEVCLAPLRPYNALKKDWPGTKAKVSTTPLRCTGHPQGMTSDWNDMRESTAEEIEYARRFVVRHDAQDVAWMLGL